MGFKHNREFSVYFPGYNNQALKYQLCIYSAHLALMVIYKVTHITVRKMSIPSPVIFLFCICYLQRKVLGTPPPFFPRKCSWHITCKFIFLYLDTNRVPYVKAVCFSPVVTCCMSSTFMVYVCGKMFK